MKISDGMNYAPKGKPKPVVKPGEFVFSAVRLDHGHSRRNPEIRL